MESSELIIRPADVDDLDAVARLERECFPDPWPTEVIRSELAASGRFHRIALIDRDPVGYLLTMRVVDEIHVNKIGVASEARRHGIAAELMAHCEVWARDNGIVLIRLEVRESNGRARSFYRSLGFGEDYARPNYYRGGETAIVLTRSVSP